MMASKPADINTLIHHYRVFATSPGPYLELLQGMQALGVNILAAATDGTTLLHVGCEKGHLPVVEFLVSQGADINAKITSGALTGATPLYCACQSGSLEVVHYLVKECKAKIYIQKSPINIAISKGEADILAFLSSTPLDKSSLKILVEKACAVGKMDMLHEVMSARRNTRVRVCAEGEEAKYTTQNSPWITQNPSSPPASRFPQGSEDINMEHA